MKKKMIWLVCLGLLCGCESKQNDAEAEIDQSLAEIEQSLAEIENSADEFSQFTENYTNEVTEFEIESIEIPDFDDVSMPSVKSTCESDLYLDGNYISTIGSLHDMLSKGFSTDIDVNQKMDSCVVSNELELYYEDVSLIVKIVNPYENQIPAINQHKNVFGWKMCF